MQMDKVANTCGHYDAFRRTLSEVQPIKFLMPNINDNLIPATIYQIDANSLVKDINSRYIVVSYNNMGQNAQMLKSHMKKYLIFLIKKVRLLFKR